MSCHLELDFNDDGTITLTSKADKNGKVREHIYPATPTLKIVRVKAGADDKYTHQVVIAGDEVTLLDGREFAA